MASLKEIKKELFELRSSMDRLTEELHDTNITIRESLNLTSETIKEMSKVLDATMRTMSDLTIQMNIRETVIKTLGIDKMIPDFFKKKK
jgi:phosphoribosyl-dephospho-CoA transferase